MERVEYLLERLRSDEKNFEYWLSLEKEIDDFLENEATEEEKKILRYDWGLMERIFMICSGYRWDKAQNLIQQYHDAGRSAELETEIRDFWKNEAVSSEKELLRQSLPGDLLT